MVGTEVSILSSAISGTLNIVGIKLAPLLIKEYSSIVGVKNDLQGLHGLVEEINCWLETAGDKAMGSGPSFSWLNRLKDVSYDVHDLVDEFHLEAEKYDSDGDVNKHMVYKYLSTKPKAFMFQIKAAHKIKAIKKRFAAIVKQRTEFSAIANSLHPACHINRTTLERPSLPNADMASVLGRDQEKHKIISKLVETDNQQTIKVLSIIGLGGSGKTALANLVFKDGNIIQNYFDVTLWVHVSQEFDVAKLLEKVFEAVVGEKSERYPLQQMTKTISEKLNEKRFLLVLDDVWTDDHILWDEFMVYLKSGVLPGSWILLTTRSRRVAEVVQSAYLFDLPFLSESDSWQVFEQSFGMALKGLDTEFLEVGKQIVKKCGGVPLAIKVLAAALHDKKHIEEWQAMRDSNLLDVEVKEQRVFACLRLSYLKLPSHLKQCFTICSLFPKGYTIYKETLIDQWIALDMITPAAGVNYLEHIGNKYFSSLVQLYFLQDVAEGSDGRVTCRMHDLVHDLALSIMGDEISLVVPKETITATKSYRYFSLIEKSRIRPPKNLYEKARAIYVAKGQYFIFDEALKNAKHLRSISVEFINTTVPTAILQIKSLRCLQISNLRCETLPEAISDLWRLQAIYVSNSDFLNLPESIGKLQKLRTLSLARCYELKSLPDSIGDCQMISSIDLTSCMQLEALPNSIGRNKKLRLLRLRDTEIERLPPDITTLGNLECLDLEGCRKLVELPEGIGNLKKLEVLNLEYCDKLEGMPLGIGQLTRLEKLNLFVVGGGEESTQISELGNLRKIGLGLTITGIALVTDSDYAQMARLKQKENLKRLTLDWGRNDGVNVGKEVAVLDGLEPPSWIEHLNIVGYAGEQYARWMLKQVGSTPDGVPHFSCLTNMSLSYFPNLKHLQRLVELPSLWKLSLSKMPSLESISGGPFPSLVELYMRDMPKLEEAWMVTEGTLADREAGVRSNRDDPSHLGQLQIGNHLSCLWIKGCPKLKVKPCLPSSVETLHLDSCKQQLLSVGLGQDDGCSSDAGLPPSLLSFSQLKLKHLHLYGTGLEVASSSSSSSGSGCGLEVLQNLTTLESLCIRDFVALLRLPEQLGDLRSLRSLAIIRCPRLSSLPQSLEHLTSLQVLQVGLCPFQQLPECLGKLRSLHILELWGLLELRCIPESICCLTSLEELKISSCPALTSLPSGIQGLTALQRLYVANCPDLQRRCEGGTGEDWWPLISHIPDLRIR